MTHLLVAESHLAPGVARHVHPAQEEPTVAVVLLESGAARRPRQLALDALVILFVDDVVHAVAVNQQVLLRDTQKRAAIVSRAHLLSFLFFSFFLFFSCQGPLANDKSKSMERDCPIKSVT